MIKLQTAVNSSSICLREKNYTMVERIFLSLYDGKVRQDFLIYQTYKKLIYPVNA